jgi:hypothetical protein
MQRPVAPTFRLFIHKPAFSHLRLFDFTLFYRSLSLSVTHLHTPRACPRWQRIRTHTALKSASEPPRKNPLAAFLPHSHPPGPAIAAVAASKPSTVLRCTSKTRAGWDDLLSHCRETSCRSVCRGCDNGNGETWPFESEEFWQHFADQHACADCEVHFQSQYEVDHVRGGTGSLMYY